jgi:hypothetical protein
MRRLRIALMLVIVGLCLPGTVVAQDAPPPPPHAFLGEVTINGQAAPVGTTIEGRGEGIRTGIPGNPITVREPGRYGGPSMTEEKLVLQGRVADGLALSFYVDGVRAECALPGGTWGESFPFQSGSVTPLNLRVGRSPVPVVAAATELPAMPPAAPTAEPIAAAPTPSPEQAAVRPTARPTALANSATPLPAAILATPTILPQVAVAAAPTAATPTTELVSVDPPPPTTAPGAQASAARASTTSARPSPTPLLRAPGLKPSATPQPEYAADARALPVLPVAGGLALAGATVAAAWYILRRR